MKHDIRLTAQKIGRCLELITSLEYRRKLALEPFRYQILNEPNKQPFEPNVDASDWPTILPQTYWGGKNINFVMQGEFTVPEDFNDGSPVALLLPLGDAGEFSHPEALVYIDGKAYASVDRHHQEIILPPDFCDGQPHQLVLHGWTGFMGEAPSEPGKRLFMRECAVVEIHQPTRNFLAAARTALQAANLFADTEAAKARLYNALDAAYKTLDTREPIGESFYATVSAALDNLRQGIAKAGPPLDVELIAAGHAHIDVAWLWTLAETRRKAGRTFQNVLRLMEQFPDYHFTQSQPQLYDYLRQDYPDLFQDVKKRVAEGRWEPIGGMWVEADCNITGAESVARQFLLGRSFFRDNFGSEAESPVLWLPDVFGYTWSLPQLIKLAGLEYFFTIKIGWNQFNKMPYDSFWWQGIDGTKVLTHFSTSPGEPWSGLPPEQQNLTDFATYNSNLNAFSVLGSWVKLKHKETQNVLLMSYGYGDGGGGPTREMNENALEFKDFPALPKVRQGRVIDFFHRLENESGDELPIWNSELYLELHRGTYTTQSRCKRANRKNEFLLHDAEFLATQAYLLDANYDYSYEKLNQAWRLLCLNQFHDIIPGSSINAVYEVAAKQYEEIRGLATAVRDSALEVIKQQIGGDVMLINPTDFSRSDLAFWDGQLPSGKSFSGDVYTQPVADGTLIGCTEISPYSIVPLSLTSGAPLQPDKTRFPLHVTPTLLENSYLRVGLNKSGDITRIYDKTCQREVLPPGEVANQFQAFEDRPVNWDAWDIDIFYDDKLSLAEPANSIKVIEDGPLRATIEIKRRILNSFFTQRISLTYNSQQLNFETTIQWQERHILLKTAFPVDVLSPVATYEIQWGSVQRPTHRNTSWDWARFETAAQKWVDLSEGGYGVALINDCKYGHDIHENVICLSLLRAPTYPDPEADQGEHRFAYSLYPHTNSNGSTLTPSEIAQIAYPFNDPLIAVTTNKPPKQAQDTLVRLPANTIVETIKHAEDGNGVIVRFYECNRQRGWITMETSFPLKEAFICNLLEENQKALSIDGQSIKLYIKPFEIVTIRLLPA